MPPRCCHIMGCDREGSKYLYSCIDMVGRAGYAAERIKDFERVLED